MTRDEYSYRTAIQRILRAGIGKVDKTKKTSELETALKALARCAPAVVSRGLSRMFTDAARAWERGNNSGNCDTLKRENANCDRIRRLAEKVLALWNIQADYPGLYPCFTAPDAFGKATFYDCQSLFSALTFEKGVTK